KDCADTSGQIRWSVEGGVSKQAYPQMRLSVAGTVQLTCQRCLTPFAHEMDSSTLLVLGKDDEDADQIEAILDDESIDVIVGSRSCDLRALIEDEALLALPQSPKHEACPDAKLLDLLNNEKPSPFAGLKTLRPE
ncbi:MAG TPA: YceD family protein, partial [Telluria sp.]|nr:YceD family protein [Telluria sp.]